MFDVRWSLLAVCADQCVCGAVCAEQCVWRRSCRLYIIRKRLRSQYSEVESEAYTMAEEHMLELEKVRSALTHC